MNVYKTHCVPTRVGHCWSESTWSSILKGGRACTTCQVYPFLILDLFSSNPLVVLGRFHGKFPWSVNVVNILPDQTVLILIWDVEVLSSKSPRVPLSKVSYNLFHLQTISHYNGHVDATLAEQSINGLSSTTSNLAWSSFGISIIFLELEFLAFSNGKAVETFLLMENMLWLISKSGCSL